jgi:hypothetical protein
MATASLNKDMERTYRRDWVFRDLPNNSDGDDTIESSNLRVPLFDVPTARMGTAGGFLRIGGGGDRG